MDSSGAGLFSDGYVNAGISIVLSCLKQIYGDEFTQSNAINNIGSIGFVGTVVGQLSFGYISDRIDRKGGMLAANVMLIIFTLLCAVGSWGHRSRILCMFNRLEILLGVAIGAEYPTSSVIASEFANQLPPGHRNRYFAWFTNGCIDFGFVVAAFVPLVLLWIFTRHLRAVWRLTIGLGVIPPLILFFLRLKMSNSNSFSKMNMKRVKYRDYPWWLIIKFYWFRLTIVSLIWFIYDFSVYSFGTFNTIIIEQIIPNGSLYQNWGWSVVFNLFYMPGTILGALSADYIGPRLTLALGVAAQGIIGIAMSACLGTLRKHIAGFVVVLVFSLHLVNLDLVTIPVYLRQKQVLLQSEVNIMVLLLLLVKSVLLLVLGSSQLFKENMQAMKIQIWNYKFHSMSVLHCVCSVHC